MYPDLQSFINQTAWHRTMFDNHIAERIDLPTGANDCYIKFKDKATSNGAMDFIYINGYLTIQGDYGNSSYSWFNRNNTIEVLAGFASNIGYFLEKIQSTDGRDGLYEWSQDRCIDTVQNFIDEYDVELTARNDDWENHTESHCEWINFMYKYGDTLNDDDYSLYDAGNFVRTRFYIHAYGLIKAMEYLKGEQHGA
jgi:hypothetical protein